MGELAEYEVVTNGTPTTMQLSPQHALILGGVPVARVEDDVYAEDQAEAKARQPANKARGARARG